MKRNFSRKVWRELKWVRHLPAAPLAIMIFLPLLYALLLGGTYCYNKLLSLPVAVCNLDEGERGLELTQMLGEAEELSLVTGAASVEEAESAYARGEVLAYVVIPADFSEKASRGELATVELAADNTNVAWGAELMSAVQGAVGTMNAQLMAEARLKAGWSESEAAAVPLTVSTRYLYNATGGYNDYFLSLLALHAEQIALVFAVGPLVSGERRSRHLLRQRFPLRYLARRVALFAVLGMAAEAAATACNILVFGTVSHAPVGALLLLFLVFGAAAASFALFIGVMTKGPVEAIMFSVAYIMPSVLFSGAIWPRFSMDAVSFFISEIVMIGHAGDNLRDLLLRGSAPDFAADLAVLLALGALFFALAYLVLERRRQNAIAHRAGNAGTLL